MFSKDYFAKDTRPAQKVLNCIQLNFNSILSNVTPLEINDVIKSYFPD